ncbi:MAG: hypothetical protein KJ949_01855 [Nanoarchaeota archaeon]|nr:hypothetical protein [Nanoarchaeota archaeon]MBU4308307.1 hypothetical protein [Nanoarchaeota archaeon]
MIKPFEYYEKERQVEKTMSNIALARSLLEKAEIRLKRILEEQVNESKSSLIFEDAYESIREAAQSLMQLKKYKPLSHEALISFLIKKKYLSQENINLLNNYRVLRNKSVYQAEKISIEKCKESIKFASEILPEIKQKFKELIKSL